MDQLALEQRVRPTDTPRADQLFDALKKIDMGPGELTQSLGRTYGAAYCVNTRINTLYLLVCEFMSDEAATKGLAAMTPVMSQMPNTTLHRKKNTVLVVSRNTGEATEPANKAIATFDAL